ncbi:ectoine/hydroxyectoine ABC transporter substrate-binding protein EhuB [Microvirga zambiensis]|uniref:ectoine/hydroxyectoine ABC transporter substrate-binding protein EhuB n=1 Tax=Microvirga zambiensis TaxID=1402137 RepID=UPI00191F9F82
MHTGVAETLSIEANIKEENDMLKMKSRSRSVSATGISTLGALMSLLMSLIVSPSVFAAELTPADTITIAIGNEPPYAVLNPDGTLTGAGPDIDRAIWGYAGITKFKGEVVPYGAMIPAVQARRVTMVSAAGLNIRPERCEQILFSEPVMCNSQAFLLQQQNASRLKGYKEIAASKVKLAVLPGSVQERAALAAGVKREDLVPFPDGTSAVKMLQDGRVDAIALNDTALIELKKRANDGSLEVVMPLSDTPMDCAAAVFNKADASLRDTYNAGLKKLVESGEYAKIMAKYGLENDARLMSLAKPTAEQCAR